ncbi:hypothetical protein AEAC466_01260 [Asticcacaulis sp. AC466]|uniref:GNAT family N-acetyltransferase n=1 Tax=Asticcacaulis sp. AC466 TaxID=1282362 RepID=UPI0003C3FE22|nr:GNAT family N-acetyltransferase [Asticcacaulis sp. AC466]ESQ85834.1 hypothetical protein AEAC466_01260 [Asticcacaulis sp. AC466]
MYEFLSYRPVVPGDARLLLDWRTAPHITKYMLTDVPYDIARQEQWIAACNARDDYEHCVIQIEGRDVGYASITVTDKRSSIGEIGVYIGDSSAPKELTAYNFVGTLNHAFFTMGLHKLVNHVVDWNDRTVRAQAFNGYRHVGVLKDHALKDSIRHDLHIFEQTAAEWAAFRKKFRDTRNWWGEETVYRGL